MGRSPVFFEGGGKKTTSASLQFVTQRTISEVQKGTDLKKRKQLASKVFEMLSHYDSVISQKLKDPALKSFPQEFCLKGEFFKELRYGENPQQKASWFKQSEPGLHSAEILQGKVLSYNNLFGLLDSYFGC